MKRLSGFFVFIGTAASAIALYWPTLPDGLPWGVGTAAWGHAAVPLCAMAAGLLAAVVSRYFGWKLGVAAALAWTFSPYVWNGAVLGEPGIALVALGIAALWALNAVMRFVLRKAIAVHRVANEQGQGTLSDADMRGWRGWVNYLAGWAFLGAALLFAVVSAWMHDYRLGEAASAYARGVVDAAGGRIVVLNGVCDEQIANEAEKRGGGGRRKVLSMTKGEAYRDEVLRWAQEEWPAETNLAVAAQVGVAAFAEVATKAHPERFYLMNGENTTPQALDRRWNAFLPYLKSTDKFVPVARRLFAYEANAVANRLQETDPSGAWKLYGRIAHEIDFGNVSAYVNRSEMLRKGYKTMELEQNEVEKVTAALLGLTKNRRQIREIVQAAGPVKADPELLVRMAEEAAKRVEAAKSAGKKLAVSPEAQSVLEMSDAMVEAADRGDLETSGRLARKILSDPQWAGWIPALAVMGDVSAANGDYAASATFYQAATSGTNETPAVVWNNYADTLMHLGRLDEAEAVLRREIAKTDEKVYVLRFSLAEVLTRKVKSRSEGVKSADGSAIEKEVRALVHSVMKNAPPEVLRLVRAKQKAGEILK